MDDVLGFKVNSVSLWHVRVNCLNTSQKPYKSRFFGKEMHLSWGKRAQILIWLCYLRKHFCTPKRFCILNGVLLRKTFNFLRIVYLPFQYHFSFDRAKPMFKKNLNCHLFSRRNKLGCLLQKNDRVI